MLFLNPFIEWKFGKKAYPKEGTRILIYLEGEDFFFFFFAF